MTVSSSAVQQSVEGTQPYVAVTVNFHGHYNEPPVSVHCPVGGSQVFDLTYDVSGGQGGWVVSHRTC